MLRNANTNEGQGGRGGPRARLSGGRRAAAAAAAAALQLEVAAEAAGLLWKRRRLFPLHLTLPVGT